MTNSVIKMTCFPHEAISKKKKIIVNALSETLKPKFHPYFILSYLVNDGRISHLLYVNLFLIFPFLNKNFKGSLLPETPFCIRYQQFVSW